MVLMMNKRAVANQLLRVVILERNDLAADVEGLLQRNTELLTYCEKLDEHEATLQTKIETLKAELAKHQGSTFHPDWSLLTATRDTVKEQQATIEKLEAELRFERLPKIVPEQCEAALKENE